MGSRRVRTAVATLAVAGLAAAGIAVTSDGGTEAQTDDSEAAAIEATLAAIDSGGPLPYEEDGGVFQNREGLLPEQPLGYYREYTVETPGSPDRGARRLVIGDGGETYYTDDHYASFTEIDPEDYR
jgi:ribonuclease T1